MTGTDKLQKFPVQFAFHRESWKYTIDLNPAHRRGETVTAEAHYYFGDGGSLPIRRPGPKPKDSLVNGRGNLEKLSAIMKRVSISGAG